MEPIEITLDTEAIKSTKQTKIEPAGYKLTVSFKGFQAIDQCNQFIETLRTIAQEESGVHTSTLDNPPRRIAREEPAI
jgi:hypothetical protein